MLQSIEKNWKERWETFKGIAPKNGGQGTAYCVVRADKSNEVIYFLKELKNQHNPGARQRMHREVSCYQTLSHPHIPKLIESNTQLFEDQKYKLYLVTEFISGPSLAEIPHFPTSTDAIECILQLCQTILYCHRNDIVHRDIKPTNIILRDGKWEKPVLVDFGLSHGAFDNDQDERSLKEEIGNRFLRLPEFTKDNIHKRDPRSDVTFCAGIFFFLLTGVEPASLLDQNVCMPHQREGVKQKLNQHKEFLNIPLLLTLFDQAFGYRIDDRFQTIEELFIKIKCLMNVDKKQNDMEDVRKQIKSIVNSPNQKVLLERMKQLNNIMNKIQTYLAQVAGEYDWAFNTTQTGYSQDFTDFKVCSILGLELKTDNKVKSFSQYCVKELGTEILISADNNVLYRHNLHRKLDEEELEKHIKEHLLNGIKVTLSS